MSQEVFFNINDVHVGMRSRPDDFSQRRSLLVDAEAWTRLFHKLTSIYFILLLLISTLLYIQTRLKSQYKGSKPPMGLQSLRTVHWKDAESGSASISVYVMDIQGSVVTGLCTVDSNERREFKQLQHQSIIKWLESLQAESRRPCYWLYRLEENWKTGAVNIFFISHFITLTPHCEAVKLYLLELAEDVEWLDLVIVVK